MTGLGPQRYLAAADEMMRGVGAVGAVGVAGGWWPKACACLIRLALESGIDQFWRQAQPKVAACQRGRTKQLMLRGRWGPGVDVARRIAFAWAALSRATHHHCYDLPPTAAELRRLRQEVSNLLARLDPPDRLQHNHLQDSVAAQQ